MDRVNIVTVESDYIHAEFISAFLHFVDDVEFCFDDENKTIHVRSASRIGYYDLGVNRRRVERIRNSFLEPTTGQNRETNTKSFLLGGAKMNMKDYFEDTKGRGVLATADSEGKVDVAVYSRPHVMDEETVAFIMADRLSHHNLQSNPHAAYLFMEEGERYVGKRLFLTRIKEEKNTELAYSLRRRRYPDDGKPLYLVYFRIEKVLPLIGSGAKK
jgi:hypothetical protein